MNYLYILFLMVLIPFYTTAQTYTIQPNDTVSTTLILNTYTDLNIDLPKSNLNDTITLGYRVVYNDMPTSWDQLLCVYGICVGSSFPAGTNGLMNPLTGANKGFVKLTINPLNLDQAAMFQIYVYDVNHPTTGDTLTYTIDATTSMHSIEAGARLMLYPNPAQKQVQVDAGKELINSVEVYQLNGQLLQQVNNLNSSIVELDVEELPQGIYMLRVLTENNLIHLQKITVR